MRKTVQSIGRALRETGKKVDRVGLTIAENEGFREAVSRHRPIMNLFEKVHFPPFISLKPFHRTLLNI